MLEDNNLNQDERSRIYNEVESENLVTTRLFKSLKTLRSRKNQDKSEYDRNRWIRQYLRTKDFEMQNKRLTTSDVAVIAKLLENLEKLVLVNNGIGDEGAIILSRSLKTNRSLKELIIYGNQIGNKGAVALSQVFKENRTIKTLSLTHNSIGDEGIVAFVDVLKQNYTLKCLNLASNKIGDKGVTALSEGLKENSTLQKLVLDDNQIRSGGAVALRKAILETSSLSEVTLKSNIIGRDLYKTINEIIWMDPIQRLWWAAEQGCPGSQFRLGRMLDLGVDGFVQNTSEAAHWFRLSAQQGDERAQLHLALMYDNGRGVDQNKSMALEWFQAAAVQGRVDGIFETLRSHNSQWLSK